MNYSMVNHAALIIVAGGGFDLLPHMSDPLGHMMAGPNQMLIDHMRHHVTPPVLPHSSLRYFSLVLYNSSL